MLGSLMDWPALFKQAYKSLRPGGYIESQEPSARIESDDGSVHEKSAMNQWGKFFIEGGRKIGRLFTIIEDNIQRKAMEEAGFIDIKETKSKVSQGVVLSMSIRRTVNAWNSDSCWPLARGASAEVNRNVHAVHTLAGY